jgi:integrase
MGRTRLIFTRSIGYPLHSMNLLREFYTLIEDAGIPCKQLHSLRHTTASLILNNGSHPKGYVGV